MKRALLVVAVAVLATGCVSGGSVRDLGAKEKEVIQAVHERIRQNKPHVQNAAKQLGELGGDFAEKEFELELALAKAKRLDSMNSFLASPPDEFRETQRAVVLYHLYEVEQAEQKVLQARLKERRASAQEISAAYGQLESLLVSAAKNLEIVLKYLNQPKSAQILAFTETFLGEVKAFHQKLAQSDSPRLKKLAAEVAQFEAQATQAKQGASEALQAFSALKGE